MAGVTLKVGTDRHSFMPMVGVTPSLASTAIRPRWRGKLTCHMRIYAHLRKRLLHEVTFSDPPSLRSLFLLIPCLNRELVLHIIDNYHLHKRLAVI